MLKKSFMIISLSLIVLTFTICIEVYVSYSNSLQAQKIYISKKTDTKDLRVPEISGLQGGYLPKNAIIIDDYKFACIIINTSSDNKITGILFQIKDKNEKSFAKFYPCKDFCIDSNKLILKSTTTKLGNISFEGNFLPIKSGNYMKVSYDTIVLKGRLVITKGKKTLYLNKNQEFTFLYGD